MTATTDEK